MATAAMPACCSLWGSRPPSIFFDLVRLEVDQHVSPPQTATDLALELVRDLVGALEARGVPELQVQVHVSATAAPPGPQLVEARDLRRRVLLDRLTNSFELVRRQRLVHQDP